MTLQSTDVALGRDREARCCAEGAIGACHARQRNTSDDEDNVDIVDTTVSDECSEGASDTCEQGARQ
jgi:hypothetical protein